MSLLVAYGVLLAISVLVSHRAHTTVLSTSVLFLAGGILVGRFVDSSGAEQSRPLFGEAARIALFMILIADGAQIEARQILSAWRLPGRALLVGLPLTIGVVALAGHFVLGLPWIAAVVIGAALSPTDPVLVRTLLERHVVPRRLRRLLSVESGLNDGLALPVLLFALAQATRQSHELWRLLAETVGGIVLGAGVSCIGLLQRVRWLEISSSYRPLLGFSIACIVFGVARLLGINELLGAYAAGVGLATVAPDVASAFRRVADPLSEALKLGVLMFFGAVLTLATDWRAIAFAAITLVAARPISLLVAIRRDALSRAEWLTAAWFGPKGFASLLYGVLIVDSQLAQAHRIVAVIGLVVVISVVAHSSTDILVVRYFDRRQRSRERRGSPIAAEATSTS